MFLSKRLVFVATIVATIMGISAAQAESTLEKIKAEDVFVAGVRYDFPPLGSVDNSGNPTGFSVDLAKKFAEALGVGLEFVQTTSKTRIPLLQSGRIDADIGPTTPTVKRDEIVDFTIPYVWDGVTLLVPKGESKDINDYGAPKTIATVQGSFVIDLIKSELPDADLKLFQEFPDTLLALRNEKVDAVGTNRFNAQQLLGDDDSLELGEDFYTDPWAIGVRENDSDWRDFLNHTMQKLWNDGIYQSLYKKHFGVEPEWHMWQAQRLQPGIGE